MASDRAALCLLVLAIGCCVYFTKSAFSPPKSCHPNPCGGGSCHLTENRRSNKRPRPMKATCTCPHGYTGLGCRWPCVDVYKSCQRMWAEEGRCSIHKQWTDWYDINCAVTCGVCSVDNRTIDARRPPFPPMLEPIETLIGRYVLRSYDHKHWPVYFPYGDTFTEEIRFEISEVPMFGTPCINYTARAVSNRDENDIQIERGFISVQDTYKKFPVTIALMRVTNNGAAYWEEGVVNADKRTYNLKLAKLQTLRSEIDGYDMYDKYPTESNRTLIVDYDTIRVTVNEIRRGQRESYTMTYYKDRNYF